MNREIRERAIEFDTYISALRDMFHGESWDQIETYAARVWKDSGLAEHVPWDAVVDRIKEAWQATSAP